ncbi:hypothetical protein V1478_008846 [Vespula squamosa]|uniref:Uncharacterized protein n=1 Tax=Vespula squamosa TaxID=30214 RepID=A0ABD2AUQ6_VESSQ
MFRRNFKWKEREAYIALGATEFTIETRRVAVSAVATASPAAATELSTFIDAHPTLYAFNDESRGRSDYFAALSRR